MDKGIRPAARNYFVEQNELRRRGAEPYTGPKADTVFRKNVMAWLMDQFGCTLASAATHYNEALKTVREATPELVAGLGRPEDKKGGRKPKLKPVAAAVASQQEDSLTVGDVLSSSILAGEQEEDTQELTAAEVMGKKAPAPVDNELTPDLGEPQTVFAVKKKSDGTVVAEGLSFEQARALVEKAAAAKKAKLYWV